MSGLLLYTSKLFTLPALEHACCGGSVLLSRTLATSTCQQSSWGQFLQEKYHDTAARIGNTTSSDVVKEVAKEWKTLSKDEKAAYAVPETAGKRAATGKKRGGLTAWSLYTATHFKAVKADLESQGRIADLPSVTSILSQRWKQMSDDDKLRLKEEAKAKKAAAAAEE